MSHLRRYSAVALIATAVVLAGACSSNADAQDSPAMGSSSAAATTTPSSPVPTGSVRLSGAVENPATLSADQLRAYPAQTQAVSFESSKGTQAHTYEGAALSDILAGAVLAGDADTKSPGMTFLVLATGDDGYQAVVSWGELSPEFGATPILVAYTEDGQPLDVPRLVVPGDVKGGRYVSGLTNLDVVDGRTS